MIDNYDVALAALTCGLNQVSNRMQIPIENHLLKSIGLSITKDSINKVLHEASSLSLDMDENIESKDNGKVKKQRLYSIFQNINIGKEYYKENYYYPLTPMDISNNIFPKKEEEFKNQDLTDEYIHIFKELEREIEWEIKGKHVSNLKDKEKAYNKIYYILEKHTTFVPCTMSKYKDISLFESLKTTSAIATCLNEYYQRGEQEENRFILLAGDVSGVQSFIYQVTEGEETKENVSKNLRGKSFYINVLIDFVSKYIVKELGLNISNILYCGGGNFQILLPNTKEVKEKLIEIESEIQQHLYKKHGVRLGLVFAHIEINDNGIKDYSNSLTKLQEELAKAKNQKFVNIINMEKDKFFIQESRLQNPCIYCYQHKATIDNILCEECNTHISLGEKLVKDRLKYIVYDFEGEIKKCDVRVSFGSMGQVCFYSKLEDSDIGFLVENINGTGKFGRIKFVGNTVPLKKGVVASFNDMAPLAEGDQKIAVLKMDIDNLGTIFSTGFEEENKSIARISTLSRMIDLFFCGYINKICENLYDEYITIANPQEVQMDNLFYINFSGGDDLVIIGPWDWTIRLAIEIKEHLSKFTCYNPNITISGGIYITDSKAPVRITLYEGEKALEYAKEYEGKDALSLLNKAFSWQKGKYNVYKLVEDGIEYANWINKEYISRNLAHDIMVGSKNIKRKGNIDFDLVPQIAYSLSRNIREEEIKSEMIRRLITPHIEDSEIEFIKYPLMIAIMKTRDVKED
ncbi:type III-A CRISPR-associated protein Cas10/Csm1 [Clostridium sp. Cult1]|uniref:type III-A CRISPR-associated protein Cas10/Csm1 n=1 Tax=Clostridium sp. Cult1 TaxID=2079002 RepID=UPI001F018DEE|nr:type III-A CRISPR-associated protein Cas10/Csm1 [Clostridium sp. Cult1]MCF6464272.1 type III-A CRISPR-associated protein Cas10/Csm1 [Clostridium sp. Cult1]